MNDDASIRTLVRAALPPTGAEVPPGDLWQRFSARESTERPRWTQLDMALLAAAALMLWLTPAAWVILVHQL